MPLTLNGKEEPHETIRAEVVEIDTHLHSYEHWCCPAAVPSGEVTICGVDTIGTFQIDGGNDTWGAWVQIAGSGDTPIVAGKTHYDLHDILVTLAQRGSTLHRIQFGFGDSGAAALAAGDESEIMLYTPAAAAGRTTPIVIQGERHTAGTKAWARVWAGGQVSGTVDFTFGLHEYDE